MKGRTCDDELCECRYRGVVYCEKVRKWMLQWPRNKPFEASKFLLEVMENDRERVREMKRNKKLY
jgi:hypothetical protein